MTDGYRDAVAYLADLEAGRGWDLGLARVERALALRGNPERRLRVLHVAGTNGKGSTAAVLESVLRASGRRTGLYTSPHLVDFAERIRAGGRTMPAAAIVAGVAELRECFERRGLALTHFEFVTVLAFEWLARIGVDVAVVEVGVGGRLDATNVVQPLATAVTSIARDHEEMLGRGLVAIAREKAGIVKPGVPVALGVLAPEADREVAAVAAARGAPLFRLGVDATLAPGDGGDVFEGLGATWSGLRSPWRAPWQRASIGVALLTLAAAGPDLRVDAAAVRRGVAAAEWPGRLWVVPGTPAVALDGAHNPAGARALAAELPRLLGGRRARVLFACGRDRCWDAMVAAIAPFAGEAVVTTAGRRPAAPEALAASFEARGVPVRVEGDAGRALRDLRAAGGDAPVLVTGSLFLVGAALAVLVPALWSPWQAWEVGATEPPR